MVCAYRWRLVPCNVIPEELAHLRRNALGSAVIRVDGVRYGVRRCGLDLSVVIDVSMTDEREMIMSCNPRVRLMLNQLYGCLNIQTTIIICERVNEEYICTNLAEPEIAVIGT